MLIDDGGGKHPDQLLEHTASRSLPFHGQPEGDRVFLVRTITQLSATVSGSRPTKALVQRSGGTRSYFEVTLLITMLSTITPQVDPGRRFAHVAMASCVYSKRN
jgi:hypothetical protein